MSKWPRPGLNVHIAIIYKLHKPGASVKLQPGPPTTFWVAAARAEPADAVPASSRNVPAGAGEQVEEPVETQRKHDGPPQNDAKDKLPRLHRAQIGTDDYVYPENVVG